MSSADSAKTRVLSRPGIACVRDRLARFLELSLRLGHAPRQGQIEDQPGLVPCLANGVDTFHGKCTPVRFRADVGRKREQL